MRRILFLTATCILCLATTTSAFNGQRKGFVLGGSFGFAPTSSWSVEHYSDLEDSGPGFGLALIIGGAFDEKNMLVYEGNVTSWNSNHVTVAQGFNGPAWYHYFGPTGHSAFTAAGLGFYVFNAEHFEENDPGLGLLFGGGYEFAPHWQVGAYVSYGKTSDPIFNYSHYHVSILVTGIAF